MIYGVLVCYYGTYKNKAVLDFSRIIKSLGREYRIIIVNNKKLSVTSISLDSKLIEVEGSNHGWEFSAWDEGIEYVKKNSTILGGDDYFVFANDTFNNHRFFNFYDKFLFVDKIKKNLHNDFPIMIGEVNSFNQGFSINDCVGSEWVSTYLFFTNFKFIEEIKPFDMGGDSLLSMIDAVDDKKIKFKCNISNNLSSHLNNWLFPKDKKNGWYGGSNIDHALLIGKVRAILNEKYLSLRCVQSGLLLNVYSSLLSSFYLRLKYYIYKYIR